MKRWRRMIASLGCKDKECAHNRGDVCRVDASNEDLQIYLLDDGTYRCESKKEKAKDIQLTREEVYYLGVLLKEARYKSYFRGVRSDLICNLIEKIKN